MTWRWLVVHLAIQRIHEHRLQRIRPERVKRKRPASWPPRRFEEGVPCCASRQSRRPPVRSGERERRPRRRNAPVPARSQGARTMDLRTPPTPAWRLSSSGAERLWCARPRAERGVRGETGPLGGRRLRHGALRRPLYRHAEPRFRNVGRRGPRMTGGLTAGRQVRLCGAVIRPLRGPPST